MTAFVLFLATPVVIGLVVILCLNRVYARDEQPDRGYLGNDGSFGSGYAETAAPVRLRASAVRRVGDVERMTRFELATSTLGRSRSTS